MSTISVQEIRSDFGSFLQRIEEGEAFVVTQDDRPLAEVRPLSPPPRQLRPYGLCAGEFTVPLDFDEPLPEEILREFEGQ